MHLEEKEEDGKGNSKQGRSQGHVADKRIPRADRGRLGGQRSRNRRDFALSYGD